MRRTDKNAHPERDVKLVQSESGLWYVDSDDESNAMKFGPFHSREDAMAYGRREKKAQRFEVGDIVETRGHGPGTVVSIGRAPRLGGDDEYWSKNDKVTVKLETGRYAREERKYVAEALRKKSKALQKKLVIDQDEDGQYWITDGGRKVRGPWKYEEAAENALAEMDEKSKAVPDFKPYVRVLVDPPPNAGGDERRQWYGHILARDAQGNCLVRREDTPSVQVTVPEESVIYMSKRKAGPMGLPTGDPTDPMDPRVSFVCSVCGERRPNSEMHLDSGALTVTCHRCWQERRATGKACPDCSPDEAFEKGREAGLEGEPPTSNPFKSFTCPGCGYEEQGMVQLECPECGMDWSDASGLTKTKGIDEFEGETVVVTGSGWQSEGKVVRGGIVSRDLTDTACQEIESQMGRNHDSGTLSSGADWHLKRISRKALWAEGHRVGFNELTLRQNRDRRSGATR